MTVTELTLPNYCRILSNPETNKPQWLKEREGMFTATDSAKLIGVGDDSAAKCIKDKAECAEADPKLRELAMVVAGVHMELAIINWYAAESPLPVERFGNLVQNTRFPYMGASPDAFAVGGTLRPLECKNVSYESGWNWHTLSQPKREEFKKLGIGEYPLPDDVNVRVAPTVLKVAKDAEGIKRLWREHMIKFHTDILPHAGPLSAPVKYYCQLQWQMSVLGSNEGVIVVVLGGTNRFDLTYRRNDALIDMMREAARTSWTKVERLRAASA